MMNAVLFVTIALLLINLRHKITAKSTPQGVRRFQKQAREQRRRADDWIARYQHNPAAVPLACPCKSPQWCTALTSTSFTSGQIFGFASLTSTEEFYNWTHINTVAWASDELMCQAHQHGARVVLAAPSFELKPDLNVTRWAQTSLFMVQARHFDGLVFDYELPMTSREAQVYVSLIRATRVAFRPHHLQVVTCVAWSPDGVDGRNYPYRQLADVSDFLYVMDYDTQSQIVSGACIASANAPYAGMILGIQRYLQLGIPREKLILGVPWYGYRYPCLSGTGVNDRFCPIPLVPFRGVNCSDAAGSEVPYSKILQTYQEQIIKSAMKRDNYMDAMYFNLVDSKRQTVYQYWFDDSISLRNKFVWAKSMGLGGIGPYTFDDLDSQEFPEQSRAMWSAFDVYRSDAEVHW